MPLTLRSKSLARFAIAARRSAAARCCGFGLDLSRPLIRIALSLNTCTVARHRADLVAALDAGNRLVELAVGQRPHPRAELAERRGDAAADHPGDQAGDRADARIARPRPT